MILSSTPVSQHGGEQALWSWLCLSTHSVMSTTYLPTCPPAPSPTHPSFTRSLSHPFILLILAALPLLTRSHLPSARCLSLPRKRGEGILALKQILSTWRSLCLGQEVAASPLLPDSRPEGGLREVSPTPSAEAGGGAAERTCPPRERSRLAPQCARGTGDSSPPCSPVCGALPAGPLTGVGLSAMSFVGATRRPEQPLAFSPALCPDSEMFPGSLDMSHLGQLRLAQGGAGGSPS